MLTIDKAPMDGTPIHATLLMTVRYEPYRGKFYERKYGALGRWQVQIGEMWYNLPAKPQGWMPKGDA